MCQLFCIPCARAVFEALAALKLRTGLTNGMFPMSLNGMCSHGATELQHSTLVSHSSRSRRQENVLIATTVFEYVSSSLHSSRTGLDISASV